MIRVIIENIALFLLPSVLYFAYLLLTRPKPERSAAAIADEAPYLWLFAAGAALVLATLLAFGSTSGGHPDQGYAPAIIKDGRIVPGHAQ